jgi:two-component system chemotaxis sensor kinase CheA
MPIDLSRFRDTFFEEAADHLLTIEAGLLQLERGQRGFELLNGIFRAAHSIKGSSGTLGLDEIARFTHALENVLDRLREATLPITSERIDLLLRAKDVLTSLIASSRDGLSGPPEAESLRQLLQKELVSHQSRSPLSSGEATTYAVLFTPHADVFRQGLDPLLLLRDLGALGTLIEVRINLEGLPLLADLDVERCWLSWSMLLRTDRPKAAIEDVFVFVSDRSRLLIEPLPQNELRHDRLASPSGLLHLVDSLDGERFGTFLVSKGLATSAQVVQAINDQRGLRPLLGQLALGEGKLTVAQVFETLNALAGSTRRFGETAVELGFLTPDDLGMLLLLQARHTPPLGELLVSNGVLSPEQLARELTEFHGGVLPSELESDPLPASSFSSLHLSPENLELVVEFCAEVEEQLEAIDRHLLRLEETPSSRETLNAAYRAFHTITGACGIFSLDAMRTLASEAETLLNLAREGKLLLPGRPMDLAFASVDALKRQVGYIRDWLAQGGALRQDHTLPQLLTELRAVENGKAPVPAATPSPEQTDPSQTPAEPLRRTLPAEKETVRVDRARLDKLINTIGELVIAQSIVQQEFIDVSRGGLFHSRALPEMAKIVCDLQELSLGLRMVPLQSTFQKMARVVRDLSRKIDKPVILHVHGDDTELDKTVVDQLGDPLMHMIRNAVDHGIESLAERKAAGKSPEGNIHLRAYHQGGNVFIELEDDGRGLDRQAILAKAIERGLVAPGTKLSDADTHALIFHPGFSTARVVTDVSGRGVGMDIVLRNVEALQGSIHIRSRPGLGTTFVIRLPLTLAIMDGLLVNLLDEIYILPLLAVIESLQLQPADFYSVAGRGEVVVIRGETVPLLRLHRLLERPARNTDARRGLIVLVENQGKKYALLVDDLLGQQQVVMKSLDLNYKKVEGVAGATILSDGRVAMILDVHGLTRLHERLPAQRAGA